MDIHQSQLGSDRLPQRHPGPSVPVPCLLCTVDMGVLFMGLNDYVRTRGRRWMRLREVVLIEEPVCRICKRKPATQVDHITAISKGGTDERDNLQGICEHCHEDKTRKELGLKKKQDPVGLDGYPIKYQTKSLESEVEWV